MDIELILKILGLVAPPIIAYVSYTEMRINKMKTRLSKVLDRKEVTEIVEYKLESHAVEVDNIKQDIRDIKATTDKVLDILIHNSHPK